MKKNDLIITPKAKIGDILSSYPELEEILIDLSPAFKKLKNPVLRKTVGKVATLQQAAKIGNISVDTIVNALRKEVGQNEISISNNDSANSQEIPDWFDESKIKQTLNAIPIINAGENPMDKIFDSLNKIGNGEILLLITPFVPAPILDILEKKNFGIYTLQVSNEEFKNYILK